jgi:farnesyl diphosphate synthase
MTGSPEKTTPQAPGGDARFEDALKKAARLVDETLETILPQPHGPHARVHEAMRYAVFAGGKRLRPFLVLSSAKLFGVGEAHALRAGAAIESLHTYSLVHDDLPCMDDDDLRRGRPTTHKAFDEMTAVLAGDALLTLAFEILSDVRTHPSAAVRSALVARLAHAAGHDGMIGGQMIDMLASEHAFGPEDVIYLQSLKTGQLFEFSCEAGAILGEATEADRNRMRIFAQNMGLVFQITDDILDLTSSAEKAGKAVGKDKEQGKATLVSIYGLERARAEAKSFAGRAVEALAPYGDAAIELRSLPTFLLDRES